MNYLFPLGVYAILGLIMTQVNPMFTDTLLPAMMVFVIMGGTILGLPSPLVETRNAGIYRSFKINGVPAASIITIPVFTTAFHALIVATIVALTATPLFDGAAPTRWLPLAGITVLIAFTYSAIGALIGVVSANSMVTTLLSQVIFLPSMLIGGMMMPLSVLPASVQSVAGLFPSTHAMQALEGLAYGRETSHQSDNVIAHPRVQRSAGLRSGNLSLQLGQPQPNAKRASADGFTGTDSISDWDDAVNNRNSSIVPPPILAQIHEWVQTIRVFVCYSKMATRDTKRTLTQLSLPVYTGTRIWSTTDKTQRTTGNP